MKHPGPSLADHAELDQLRQQNRLLLEQQAALQAQLQRTQQATSISDLLTDVPALDVAAVQSRMLQLIHDQLGYERAIIASYDAQNDQLTGWRCSCDPSSQIRCVAQEQPLPLRPAVGILAQAAATRQPQLVTAAEVLADAAPLAILPPLQQYAVLPLVVGESFLGVLLVDNPASQQPLTDHDQALLAQVARDMAVVLLVVQRAIDRAHHALSETERSRSIAQLHETLVQPLYGLSYAFEATMRMVPAHDTALQDQMRYLQAQVQAAKSAIQGALFDFWPEQLDAERLAVELRAHARNLAAQLVLEVVIDPHYDALPLDPRQQLLQIARDALGRVVDERTRAAAVRFSWSPTQLQLVVASDGSRQTLDEALATHTDEQGLAARVAALGGRLELSDQPSPAVSVCVTLPAAW